MKHPFDIKCKDIWQWVSESVQTVLCLRLMEISRYVSLEELQRVLR